MNSQKIKDVYKKKILPKKYFGTFNAILAFAILIFILFTSFTRCKDGKLEGTIALNVSPIPFEEATPAEIKKLLQDNIQIPQSDGNTDNASGNAASSSEEMKSVPQAAADSSTASANTNPSIQNQNNPRANAENREWTTAFLKFAKKIEITDIKNMYALYFKIYGFPLNHQNPDYLQIDYEFYNDQMEYLFTFNADNYWNQSGYDDGHWHEYSYTDKLNVKFARLGAYYVIACIPKDRFSSVMYNMVKTHSNGRVVLTVSSGIMPLSIFSVFSGFVFFLTTGIILLKKRNGNLARWSVLYIAQKIQDFDYIIKLPDSISKDLFYIKGIIKQQLMDMNNAELILEQDNRISYLEIERETTKNNKSAYNYYYYNESPSHFDSIPDQDKIAYNKKNYKLSYSDKKMEYQAFYSNGMIEKFESKETVYHTPGWESILVFEAKPQREDFEVLLAKKIDDAIIWKVPKIKETD